MDCYAYAVRCCCYKTSDLLAFVKKSSDFSYQNILFTKYYLVLCVWGEKKEVILMVSLFTELPCV